MIFKIPPYKPSLAARFIRFMQRARHHSRDYADIVHAAVVTGNSFGEVEIAHYVNSGYQQGMIAALLRHEKVTTPNKIKKAKVYKELNDVGNAEEICSSYV